MIKIIETFSGIGSQAKALQNIGADHKIEAIVEWDINAIIAYDLIHNGIQPENIYNGIQKIELVEELSRYTLSADGKSPMSERALKSLSAEMLRRLLYAIERNNNLVSITDVKGEDLPEDIDVLTYSFPCQDLSACAAWHGNTGGINRKIKNRSGMLWEIERILDERKLVGKSMPRFLLMENVKNILTQRHIPHFNEWQDFLQNLGYINRIYTLDASEFGIPQKRERTYMLSILSGDNYQKTKIIKYLMDERNMLEQHKKEMKPLKEFLRLDYSNLTYRAEAESSCPNDTESRRKIFDNNECIWYKDGLISPYVSTITTKQDRHPNSGVIEYDSINQGKANYRYLSPRECFLLMGFDESDFDILVNNNFHIRGKDYIFTTEKLVKMAGNSIVVNVLEEIFRQVIELDSLLGYKEVSGE